MSCDFTTTRRGKRVAPNAFTRWILSATAGPNSVVTTYLPAVFFFHLGDTVAVSGTGTIDGTWTIGQFTGLNSFTINNVSGDAFEDGPPGFSVGAAVTDYTLLGAAGSSGGGLTAEGLRRISQGLPLRACGCK
jgi:hypothetical protein